MKFLEVAVKKIARLRLLNLDERGRVPIRMDRTNLGYERWWFRKRRQRRRWEGEQDARPRR